MTATSEVTPIVTLRSGPVEHSADIAALAKALVIFQDKVRSVKKGKTAKVEKDGRLLYTYQYADLGDVIEDTREARTAAELAVVQQPCGDARNLTVVTTLLHSSGQWMRSSISGVPAGGKPQELGSLITYLRRYSYSAALGICTEVDDDGNAAQGNAARIDGRKPIAGGARPANKVAAAPSAPMATDAQKARIHILKGEVGGMTDDAYRKALGAYKNLEGFPVKSSTELTVEQADNLITRLDGMKARQADAHAAMEEATPDNVSHLNAEREEDDARMRSGMADEPTSDGAPVIVSNAEHAVAVLAIKQALRAMPPENKPWTWKMIKLWFAARWPDLGNAVNANDVMSRLTPRRANAAADLLRCFGKPVYDAALAEMVGSGEVEA